MIQTPRSETITHLVVGSTNPDKETQLTQVQNYQQAYDFVAEQPPEHDVSLNWHYLDPQLPRKLSICFARRAVRLCDDLLEIPRFVARATEPLLPSYELMMGNFGLQASNLRNPAALYERYATLAERMRNRDMAELAIHSHNTLPFEHRIDRGAAAA